MVEATGPSIAMEGFHCNRLQATASSSASEIPAFSSTYIGISPKTAVATVLNDCLKKAGKIRSNNDNNKFKS